MNEINMNKLFDSWAKEKEEIAQLFRIRQKQAVRGPMQQQSQNFIHALFAANEMLIYNQSNWQEEAGKLTITPINLQERLAFILARPSDYHSYIQLAELFDELQKQYEKAIAMKKGSSHKINRLAD